MIFNKCLFIILFFSGLVTFASGNNFGQMEISQAEMSEKMNEKAEISKIMEDEDVMDAEIEMFREAVGISKYASRGAVSALHGVGCGELKKVNLVSNKRGYVVKVIDSENQVYYVGLGGLGYVEIIRKDSEDGEILYGAVDD